MASATEEEEFTADDVFGMLVESSNVIKVAYTQVSEPAEDLRVESRVRQRKLTRTTARPERRRACRRVRAGR